ncbi:MAG: FecR family protein [Firmicutes bacterium]|nr:FecR family protein [Bacillota bacterium]
MKQNLKFVFMFILAICTLLLLPQPSMATSPDWKLVVKVSGRVESQKADQTAWVGIWQSRMLKDGDKARTLENSIANIRLADQTIIKMGSSTVVEISKFQMNEQSRIAKLKLDIGALRVKTGKFTGKESKFEVKTPNGVLAARGTDFLIVQEKVTRQGADSVTKLPGDGNTEIYMFNGDAEYKFYDSDGNLITSVTLHAGDTMTCSPDGTIYKQSYEGGYKLTTVRLTNGKTSVYTEEASTSTRVGLNPEEEQNLSNFFTDKEPVNLPPTVGQIVTNYGGTPGGNMPPPGGGPGPGGTYMNLDPSIRVLNPTLDISF